jgi:CHC2 zinc finger
MIRPQERRNPFSAGVNCRTSTFVAKYTASRKTSPRLPNNWRERLPDPSAYYAQHVAKMGTPVARGWASGLCPFHDDRSPSFSVNLTDPRGSWRCHASCGSGDLVGFHMKRTGQSFRDAVGELIGGLR